MAPENGRAQFDALGKNWALQFDVNAFCRIEAELGIETVHEFQEVLQKKLSFTKLRTLFCCGLQPAATEEEAGNIMTDIGIERATDLLTGCLEAAFPDSSGAKAKGSAGGKAKKANAGTG